MGFQTCKYRKGENGEIESRLFDSDEIPPGWKDSPADISNNGSDPIETPEKPEEPEAKATIFKKKRKKRSN